MINRNSNCLAASAFLAAVFAAPLPAVASHRGLVSVRAGSSDSPQARVLVKFKEGVEVSGAQASIRVLGLWGRPFQAPRGRKSPIERWWVVGFLGDEGEALRRFASDAAVERVEPDYEISISTLPNDPGFPLQWGLHNEGLRNHGTPGADIRAPEAWDLSTGDPSVVVAVLDTGVDYNHPDLVANIWTNQGEIPGNGIDDDGNGYVDDVHGYNLVGASGPWDDNGHGTHVAGIIGAEGGNGVGVTGVAWRCRILPVRFLDHEGHGWTSDAIDAILYATATGAKVLNGSWTATGYSEALRDAIATANDAGALFVTAAGNGSIYGKNGVLTSSGVDIDATPQYPASYDLPNVLTVTATDNADNLAGFGDWGRYSAHLGAPGVGIPSTDPSGYSTADGTSLAAAHVSGAAALLFARFPGITHLEVKGRLLGGVDPIPALANRTVTGGRLNVFKAMQEDPMSPAPASDLAVTAVTGRTVTLSWTATGDDGTAGRALRYELRYFIGASPLPLDEQSFRSGALAKGLPAPSDPWTPETFTLTGLSADTPYSFVLAVVDEVGNLSLSPVVPATTLHEEIVFSDDMEGGGKWTVSGSEGVGGSALWHLSTRRSGSPATAFYYGREYASKDGANGTTLTYSTGARNHGSVTSGPIDLSGRAGAWLSFRHFLRTENLAPYDNARVSVSTDDGTTWTDVYSSSVSTPGAELVDAGADLSAFVGQAIRLRFSFDSLDATMNDLEGWVVDDVVVTAVAVPDPNAPPELPVSSSSVEPDWASALGGSVQVASAPRPEGVRPHLSGPRAEPVDHLDSGITRAGWSGACTGSVSSCSFTTDDSEGIPSTLRGPQPLMLSVKAINGGRGTVSLYPQGVTTQTACSNVNGPDRSCDFPYALDSEMDLYPMPEPLHVFVGWGGACSGVNACHLRLSEARNVTATFRGPEALTLTVEGGRGGLSAIPQDPSAQGFGCDNFDGSRSRNCSTQHRVDTVLELSVAPASDSIFLGWGGACQGIAGTTCQVTMSHAQGVTASFRIASRPPVAGGGGP